MIRRDPRAERAIVQLALWIGLDSPATADRFICAVDETLQTLETHPLIGRVYDADAESLRGLRIWSVSGFPNHLLFYRPAPGGIELVHVLHGARDIGRALDED